MVAPGVARPSSGCLDDNLAAEFVSGSMPRQAVTRVEGHLAGCRDCRDLVAALAGTDIDVNSDSAVETEPRQTGGGSGLRPLPAWSIGDRIGRYVVLSILGQGGMGVVFAAYDPQLDRKIALKLLRTNSGMSSKDARARLRREAQAIAQLSHPNVVNVYDVGATDGGDVYIAMEFVEGDNLSLWLKKWERSPREIVDVFLQAARGLAAAHAVGLLHRDFKPDNVLVGGDGRVRVTDFGLARSVLGPDEAPKPSIGSTPLHVELTATGTVLGTPRYMPPEQVTGSAIDARADQFSFCVALYEALFGAHPLPGETAISMIDRGARAVAPPEKKGVAPAIGRALVRGLEKERERRHPSMAAVIAELAPRAERRSPGKVIAVGLSAIIVAGAATAAVMSLSREKQPTITMDPETQRQLLRRIEELEKDRKELLTKLTAAQVRASDVDRLKQELDVKTKEVNQLAVKLAEIQVTIEKMTPAPTKQVAPAKPVIPPQEARAIAAIEAPVFEGCFQEWHDRERHKDADVPVTLTVLPDGHTHTVVADFADSPVLEGCIAAAVARVVFAPGPEELDLKALVRYSSEDGTTSVSALVVGRRAPSAAGTVDIKE